MNDGKQNKFKFVTKFYLIKDIALKNKVFIDVLSVSRRFWGDNEIKNIVSYIIGIQHYLIK